MAALSSPAAGAKAADASASPNGTAAGEPCPWWQVVVAALGIWGLSWLGAQLSTLSGDASPLWPAAGLGAWAVLRRGRRMLLAVAVGGLLGKAFMGNHLLVAVATLGSVVEAGWSAWLGHRLLRRRTGLTPAAVRGGTYLIMGLTGPLPAVALGAGTLWWRGVIGSAEVAPVGLTWWVGDLFGILLLVPLLDAWAAWRRQELDPAGGWVWGLATVAATALAVALGLWPDSPGGWLFAVLPVLLVAKRWQSCLGVHGAALAIAVMAVVLTATGHGPFHSGAMNTGLLRMELFLLSIVITALALPLFRDSGNFRLGAAVLVGGWLLGAVVYDLQRRAVRDADEVHLQAEVRNAADALSHRMAIYTEALRAGDALFQSSGEVTFAEWRRFATTLRLPVAYPGINGIGTVLPVRADEVETFNRRLAHQHGEGHVMHPVPGAVTPARESGEAEHYVITFIEPVENNREAVGLDVGSEANRREAADAARDTGRVRISRRIVLVQDGEKRAGFLLYLPVYHPDRPLESVAERRAAFSHWVYAPFVTELFVEGALSTVTQELALDFFEGRSTASGDLLYAGQDAVVSSADYDAVSEIELAGEPFTLGWRKTARFASPDATAPAWIGSGIVLASLALAGLVTALQSSHRRAQALVLERTSELEAAHEHLAELAAWQGGVLDSNNFAIVSTDPNGVVRTFNRGAERMLGYPRNEVIGRVTPAQWHKAEEVAAHAARLSRRLGETVAPGFETFVALADRGTPEAQEWTYVCRDGTELPVRLTVSAVRNARGEITGYMGISEDLTERKQAEASRREAMVELTTLKQALDQHVEISVTDADGAIIYANAKLCENSGYSHRELLGRTHEVLDSGEQPPAFFEEMWATLRAGRNWRGDIHNRAKDGRVYWVDTLVVPQMDAAGELWRMVSIRIDVTRNRDYEQGLARARDEALTLSRLKSEFLANISHELRTPMNGVIGMAALLADTPLDDDRRRMVEVIRQSGESLLTIINDILDLSKMEAGKMRLTPSDFDLAAMLRESVELLVPRVEAKPVSLRCEIPPAADWWVHGDEGRLRQVVINLLGNAIKFTAAGTIALRLIERGTLNRRRELRLEVEDTGCGIPHEVQDRLFQSFVQVDGSDSRAHGGTGLGLSISRQILEQMGGTIGVESEPGRGATFWIEFSLTPGDPLRAAAALAAVDRLPADCHRAESVPADEPDPSPASAGPSLRVLLVEDNDANQQVARLMLERLGHRVGFAGNGAEALECLAAERFDAVLMDCQMPVLDGFEATRRLRSGAVAGADAKVPVIALTAYAMPGDRQRCLDAGMDDYLTKPLRKREVAEKLAAVRPVGAPPPPASAPSDGAPAATPATAAAVLDPAVVAELSELETETGESVFAFVTRQFFTDCDVELVALERLLAQAEWAEFAQRVHRFGGSAASFGGMGVRRTALALEKLAKSGDAATVRAAWPQLAEACTALRGALAANATPVAAPGGPSR